MTFSHQFYFSNISSDRLKTSTYFKNLTDQNIEKKTEQTNNQEGKNKREF